MRFTKPLSCRLGAFSCTAVYRGFAVLHILVESLVRFNHFFTHVISIYILCRMVITHLLIQLRDNHKMTHIKGSITKETTTYL